ncbi:MAG: type II secretion system F family protein [Actinomycetales bacterium]|jgi:tight adherence protein B
MWRPERRHPRLAGAAADEAAGAIERLATLLEAGVAPESAWMYLGEFSAHPVVSQVASTVSSGVRPIDAFAASTGVRAKGAEPWRALAAAWAVAEASGAPLAPSLRELATALGDRAETEREIEVALAGPLATSRLVAWLPVAGLGLGMLMGVDILGTLLGSVVGGGVLVLGGALMLGGRFWTRLLARSAAPSPGAVGLDLDLVAVSLTGGVSVERAREFIRQASNRFGIEQAGATELDDILALAQRAGAPAVELLRSAARQARRDARTGGKRAAATLAVRLMVPLGVCILPSFMLLGVAPVVLSILSSTISAL